MTMLSRFSAGRYPISSQFRHILGQGARRLASTNVKPNALFGSPDYPTPGTQAYSESMTRLQDSHVLEMLSRSPPSSVNSLESSIQKWMQQASIQHAELLQQVDRLTQKVEKLESKLKTS